MTQTTFLHDASKPYCPFTPYQDIQSSPDPSKGAAQDQSVQESWPTPETPKLDKIIYCLALLPFVLVAVFLCTLVVLACINPAWCALVAGLVTPLILGLFGLVGAIVEQHHYSNLAVSWSGSTKSSEGVLV